MVEEYPVPKILLFNNNTVQVNVSGNAVTFTANFPAYTYYIYGFAVAALTVGNDFAGPQNVTAATIAGPATIELVN